MWEAVTAVCLLQAGADIVLLRHPNSVKVVRSAVEGLMAAKT
jgi:CO dehydrogenase/acetyl-CoA synthase delta subunit